MVKGRAHGPSKTQMEIYGSKSFLAIRDIRSFVENDIHRTDRPI